MKKLTDIRWQYAMRNTLNDVAFLAKQTIAPRVIRQTLHLRNKYTLGSLRVNKATIATLRSEIGSIQPYMRLINYGGVRRKEPGSHSVPIPSRAVTGGEGRPKLPPFALTNRGIKGVVGVGDPKLQERLEKIPNIKAKIAVLAKLTKGQRKRVAIINRELVQFRGKKTRMLWDIAQEDVRVKRRPWVEKVLKLGKGQIHRIFTQRAWEQVNR